MRHRSIRTRLIITYFASVAVSVLLVPFTYHWLANLLGWEISLGLGMFFIRLRGERCSSLAIRMSS